MRYLLTLLLLAALPLAAQQKTNVQKDAAGNVAGNLTFTGNNTLGNATVSVANVASITGALSGANGGTGVINSGKTITLAGNLTLDGAFSTTITATAETAVTLPTNGLLANTAYVDAATAAIGTPRDIKFIMDGQSVPDGWSLTGVNGIPAFTTPDADYKAVFQVDGTVADVTFDPAAGEVPVNAEVTIATVTSGASIRYTTNGDTPTRSSGTVYSAPVVIDAEKTLKAIAYKDYSIDAAVVTAAYTAPPASPTFISITTATPSNTTTATVNRTQATASDGYLIVAVRTQNSPATSATYDGNAMTLVDNTAYADGVGWVRTFGIVLGNKGSGTYAIVVSADATMTNIILNAIHFDSVNQSTPTGTVETTTATFASSRTLNITTVAGDLAFGVFLHQGGTVTGRASDQDSRYDGSVWAIDTKPAVGTSTTMSWTNSAQTNVDAAGFALKKL